MVWSMVQVCCHLTPQVVVEKFESDKKVTHRVCGGAARAGPALTIIAYITSMPAYSKSERTARKARKQARLDAAATVQQAQVQHQEAMQARLELLMADNALMKKQASNRKKRAISIGRRQDQRCNAKTS